MLEDLPEEGAVLIGRISEKLMRRKLFLAAAESCTGGLASAFCTALPGSSRWLRGGVTAYDNRVKSRLLGVEAETLARHGAVSGPVAEAMAQGALAALEADLAFAISGIAGPEGGSPDKPVGTVWIATALQLPEEAGASPRVCSFSRVFPGGRSEVRSRAALEALCAVEAALDGC